MQIDRRRFLAAGATAAAAPLTLTGCAGSTPVTQPQEPALGGAARAFYPQADARVFLNAASQHPLGTPMLKAMQRHLDYQVHGPGEGRAYFSRDDQAALKREYGALINAKDTDIVASDDAADIAEAFAQIRKDLKRQLTDLHDRRTDRRN